MTSDRFNQQISLADSVKSHEDYSESKNKAYSDYIRRSQEREPSHYHQNRANVSEGELFFV